MSVVDEYLETLNGPDKVVIEYMYAMVRKMAPSAIEELSYAMPSFTYNGRGLVAVMANKSFLSLYPFAAVETLGLDLSAFECTIGSIHFSADKPIPDDLLRSIITARMRQIDSGVKPKRAAER